MRGCHDWSFFGTICNDEAQEDVEGRIMPADSKHLNSALAILSLSRSRKWALAKMGGVHRCERGANPEVGLGTTSPGQRIVGNFARKL